MTQTIKAPFDGKVIVPDEPVQLPVGQTLRVHLEVLGVAVPRASSIGSPRLAYPEQAADFKKEVVEETQE